MTERFYCPICRKPADKITEVLESESYTENRVWNGDSYELVSSSLSDSVPEFIVFCSDCGTILNDSDISNSIPES